MSDLHGDVPLAAILQERLGSRHHRAAVAVADRDGVRTAAIGAVLDADYEIGSLSKGITGLLYADSVARGEISPTTTLGTLLPLADSPAGAVTLESLATHRSGLPRLPFTWDLLRRTWDMYRRGTNPYGDSLATLLTEAQRVKVKKPKPRYSNLGYELLGHAVAAAAQTSYRELVHSRIAEPLQLDAFYVPHFSDELTPNSIHGVSKRGKPHEPWTGEALGPAGGIRASIGAMGTLAQALLDSKAPGVQALEPQESFQGGAIRIGAGWLTTEHKGREITWYNGRTGGFSAWMGLDRAEMRAVVLLTATAVSVDRHGFTLLHEIATQRAPNAGSVP